LTFRGQRVRRFFIELLNIVKFEAVYLLKDQAERLR
jgi:hypothetical protein